jgi:hypothetical protein
MSKLRSRVLTAAVLIGTGVGGLIVFGCDSEEPVKQSVQQQRQRIRPRG